MAEQTATIYASDDTTLLWTFRNIEQITIKYEKMIDEDDYTGQTLGRSYEGITQRRAIIIKARLTSRSGSDPEKGEGTITDQFDQFNTVVFIATGTLHLRVKFPDQTGGLSSDFTGVIRTFDLPMPSGNVSSVPYTVEFLNVDENMTI